MSAIASLPVAVPLSTAAIILFLNGVVSRRVVQALALTATLAEVGLAAALMYQTRSRTSVYWFGGWTPRAGVALGISFTIDQLGAGAALLAGIATAAAVATTRYTIEDADGIVHSLLLTLLAAMAGFCLTGDLFNLFVFFELMAVCGFALTAYHSRSLSALRSALNFAITTSIGAFAVLIGIALLYSRTGALNMAQIGRQLSKQGGLDRLGVVALALLIVGLLIKAAVAPFHFWLIDTATSAPMPLVIILAGVLDSLGVYGIARIYWTMFAPSLAGEHHALQTLLIVIGAITAVAAGGVSVLFAEPRRRVAFVMVAHTGIVLIGVGCLTAPGVAGAAIYAVGDGTVKAGLFIGLALLGFGLPGERSPDRVPTGRRRQAGLAIVTVGGLATAGLPLFATGLGKVAIDDAASAAGYPWVTPVIVLTAAFTGGAVLNIARRARDTSSCDVPDQQRAPWTLLVAVGVVLLALSAIASFTGGWAATAGSRFVATSAYQQVVLDGRIPPTSVRAGPIGLSASGALVDLLGVGAAVMIGEGIGRRAIRRAGRVTMARRAWFAVCRAHDGSIGDAATWATLGAAAIALVLATSLR